MLHELTIADLGVIASARLSLGRGLTVVTGETGAGKTMVLTGLGLVTGGKAPSAVVRAGAEVALAEAVIDVPAGSAAEQAFADAGAVRNDDGTVLVSRSLGAGSRSRTTVGGRQIPQALLADCAADMVTVHGQSDQARLRSATHQRNLLDEYAGQAHLETLGRYREAWQQWRSAREELDRMREGAENQVARVAQMRDDLAAIERVDPQPGEDEALADEAALLENAESVRVGAATAAQALAGDDEAAAGSVLAAARRALADAAAHDKTLAALAARLDEHAYGVADVASEITSHLETLAADPARLEVVHQRRSDISALCRRLGATLDGVLAYAEEARARLAEHDNWDESLAAAVARVSESEAHARAIAAEVSQSRHAAGARLAEAVSTELAQLAMAEAKFDVSVADTDLGADGADAVAMTLAAHPGAPQRPVAEAASGGELSRIMLAIEVSLAAAASQPGHTFVFDEVDAGVGGKAAIDVGRRLAALARTHQVLVVTHLAQVAAYADHHIVVSKGTDGSVTTSQVHEVVGEDRVQEIARLLSGQEDSATARAHALELLEGSGVAR